MMYKKSIDRNSHGFLLQLIFGDQPVKTAPYVKQTKCIASLKSVTTKAEPSWAKPSQAVQILQCIHTEADSDAVNFRALYLIYP